LQFLQTKTEVVLSEYKRIRATVKREKRIININNCDINILVSNIEYDVHGRQETAGKILRQLNKTGIKSS
jgi:hypothetical protein